MDTPSTETQARPPNDWCVYQVRNSGKLLILGIVALAVLLAGAGWWFRYNATHRAASFWGPDAVRLIRDAPIVKFVERSEGVNPDHYAATQVIRHDISRARGLTHLRNALLEDRSFDWSPPGNALPHEWRHWGLLFRESESTRPLVIWFSGDFRHAMTQVEIGRPAKVISCEPIAKGLGEMFSEFAAATPER